MHGMTLELEHLKRVEEMDAVEFRRYAKTLPEAGARRGGRQLNAWPFRRWYEASDRHRPRTVMSEHDPDAG
jgi:hypothetical protein